MMERILNYVGGELVVERPAQPLGRLPRLQVQVCHLLEGMHAGVRAAGAVGLEVAAARDPLEGLVEGALDGAGILLDLPAAVPGPHVLEIEAEASHARQTLAAPRGRVKGRPRCYSDRA